MLIQEIITNAEDLAGGELIRAKLDRHFSMLIALNVFDTMMLELSLSPKEIRGIKQSVTLSANTDTGTLDISTSNLDSKMIRIRRNSDSHWRMLDVVENIDDLTKKQNLGKLAILFVGTASPLTYYLSFTPVEDIEAEVWTKQASAELTDLNEGPPFPPEFGLVAAYRICDFLLNQLLLIDAKNFMPFVQAQKATMSADMRRVEFIWTGYRFGIPDGAASSQPDDYNFLTDAGDRYDNVDEMDVIAGAPDFSGVLDP
jgi:hypothetical protein